jgi:hypothetical protein
MTDTTGIEANSMPATTIANSRSISRIGWLEDTSWAHVHTATECKWCGARRLRRFTLRVSAGQSKRLSWSKAEAA